MISIVLTTYNGSKYIAAQLQSILNQTYTDFEIIIVDDQSSDDTLSLINIIFKEANFTDFKIIVNERNLGPTKGFEKGVMVATREFVAFSDQDDIWLNTKLEKFYNEMMRSSATLVCSSSYVFSDSGLTNEIFPSVKNYKTPFGSLFHNQARGATMMLKRNTLVELMPFCDLYDKWIYLNLVYTGKIIHLDEPLHHYRIHSENVNGGGFRRRSLNNVVDVQLNSINFYKSMLKFASKNIVNESLHKRDVVLKAINDLIKMHEQTIEAMLSKNKLASLSKYFKYVAFKELSLTEKAIYFYYFILKFK